MKRNKKLIILSLVLLILIGASVVVKNIVPDENEIKGAEVYSNIGQGEVAALEWTYEGETVKFIRTDDGWSLDSDEAFPVNAIMLDSMESAVTGELSSIPVIGVDALEYGIDDASDSITVTKKDGTELSLTFGNLNDVTNEYYATLEGSDKIYMVEARVKESFEHTKQNVLKREEIPSLDNAVMIDITRGDSVLSIKKDGEVWKSGDEELNSDKTSELVKTLSNFIWTDCVDYNATDFSAYGLSPANAEVRVELSDGNVIELMFGTEFNDSVYVKYKNSKMVYYADNTIMEKLQISATDLK